MLQRTRHASMASTCATPCNAMLHCFHSKHFLGSIEICVQHWTFLVCIEKHWVSLSSLFSSWLRSRMVEKDACGQNGAAWRTRNLERNTQKTYIASASSTSAKRSWSPCWKFDIALGCLKLQETEFYLCFTGIKSVHDPVISWHSSTPCKIWGSNGRLDWKQWR